LIVPHIADILLKSLANPTRRAIFERLVRGGEQPSHADRPRPECSSPQYRSTSPSSNAPVCCPTGARADKPITAAHDALVPLMDWVTLSGVFWRDRFDRLEAC
jgi:hypothetical protein